MNTPEKDYSHRGWIAALALIAVLGAVSFIPPQSLGGVKLRRANILSDILSFEDAAAEAAEPALFDEDDFHVDMAQVARRIEAERIEADTAPRPVQTIFEWLLRQDSSGRRAVVPDTVRLNPALVAIEQFAPADSGRLRAFYDTLLYARRPVRIAVLGDSFIEGDILTADLREKLQQAYGGGGAGFAPMASPLTAFRRTIKTQSKGWTAYNIMQRKAAPQNLRGHFFVSGWVCQPSEGASTRWENTDYRQRLDSCTAARVFFISPGDSRIELTLNDSLRREFEVEGAAAVRQVTVTAPHIRSLAFKVNSGTEGFIGYGAVFEADGVVVDNYSVRSNNGQAMFWTNPSVNAQINAHAGYDLVILQYGLNIMQTGVHNYTGLRPPAWRRWSPSCSSCFPDGGRAGARRQRPFGEDRRRLRTHGCHRRRRCSTTSAGLPENTGAAFLADLRRHAFAGRHGTVSSPTAGPARTTRTSTTPAGASVAWCARRCDQRPRGIRSPCRQRQAGTHPPEPVLEQARYSTVSV